MRMHSYDRDGDERVILSITCISILLTWLMSMMLDRVNMNLHWLLAPPSVVAIYVVIYNVFDRYLWKLGLMNQIHLISLPDLSGDWKGIVVSSYGDLKTELPVELNIDQRWSKILITLRTQHSNSHSITATIKSHDTPNPELSYIYENRPNIHSAGSLHRHQGTAILILRNLTLEGEYYTDRDRRQIGLIKLVKTTTLER